jgi:Ca2+-transporting ATPase
MAVSEKAQAPAAEAKAGADTEWHRLTAEAVAQNLGVDPAKGLSKAEAEKRLQQYGPNQLAGKRRRRGFKPSYASTGTSCSSSY